MDLSDALAVVVRAFREEPGLTLIAVESLVDARMIFYDFNEGRGRSVSSWMAKGRPRIHLRTILGLIVREDGVFALVPPVVVQDEIASSALVATHRIIELQERFYTVTARMHFPNPLVSKLIEENEVKWSSVGRHGHLPMLCAKLQNFRAFLKSPIVKN